MQRRAWLTRARSSTTAQVSEPQIGFRPWQLRMGSGDLVRSRSFALSFRLLFDFALEEFVDSPSCVADTSETLQTP